MSKIEVNQISSQCGSTLTIGQSGDSIQLACGATQTGFGRTGTVDWDTTAKTASFTAVSGNGYFVNTTSGAITVTLPATPSAGDIVSIADYAGTALTNAITIARNGSNINGGTDNLTINKNNSGITLVYVDGTQGWKATITSNLNDVATQPEYIVATGGTVTCCGDYKIHTFTGPGTFTVCSVGNPVGSDSVEYIVVAGGGGGGSCNGGGGGGGSVVTASCESVCAQAYPIAVGAGGTGGVGSGVPANKGNNTTFFGITAISGGGGFTSGNTACAPAGPYGNGGAGAGVSDCVPGSIVGQSGTASSPIPASATNFGGNSGGDGTSGTCGVFRSGGGGGAGGNGNPGLPGPTSAQGAAGTPSNICGTTYIYAGGGGGGVFCGAAGAGGLGGAGGGGAGCNPGSTEGAAGPGGRNPGSTGGGFPIGAGGPAGANTGSGGGGGGRNSPVGGSGGSGIVIIKYKYQN